jgi:hydroxymethylpyrimidine/phosphomethylpyrimidine kinase
MRKRRSIPVALTIAGSDSGGGAGIQADLKTFAALGVHGTSVVTCITAQNPKLVCAIEPCSGAVVTRQLDAVIAGFKPKAVKTGMLYTTEILEAVVRFLDKHPITLVVDPVLMSTSGKPLLKRTALESLRGELLPLATLVTPNLAEAEVLAGSSVRSIEQMRAAARAITECFGCATLVKGGHLQNHKDAVDIFFDGREELLLRAPFVANVRTHGTGCTYSAAITAYLARGFSLKKSVLRAKDYVSKAIAGTRKAGEHEVIL